MTVRLSSRAVRNHVSVTVAAAVATLQSWQRWRRVAASTIYLNRVVVGRRRQGKPVSPFEASFHSGNCRTDAGASVPRAAVRPEGDGGSASTASGLPPQDFDVNWPD